MPILRKPKNEFGLEVDNFRAKTGMPVTELARMSDVRYSTLIECTTGRSAGHELKPKVRAFMKGYCQDNKIAEW